MRTARLAIFGLVSALSWLTACDSCRGDRPYTPFGVTSALPSAIESASAPPPASSALEPKLSVKKAVLAPPAASRFAVDGREIQSPDKRVFEQALTLDPNADGKNDILAWTLPDPKAPPGEPPGELWLYPAEGEKKKIVDFPPFLPTGEGCRTLAVLAAPTAVVASLEVQAVCPGPLLARSPTRALVIVDPTAARPLRFGLRAADPAPGETLKFALTAGDEDADGRDDFRLTVDIALGGGPPLATASIVWLDRAAGISRDMREPGKSLADAMSKELARAQKKKTALLALEHVNGTRRLLASLCAEGGTARLFDWDGGALRCGALATVVDRLAGVEVAADLALADVASALGVLVRDGWYFGALGKTQKNLLTKELEKKLVKVPAARIVIGVRPRAARSPAYSPLTFDPSGSLLIQADSGLFRLAPDGAREEPVGPDGGIEAWPLEVAVSPGNVVSAVSYSCDRSEVALLVSGANAESTSLLAPRPGVCGGRPFDDHFVPAPISSASGLAVLIGGAIVTTPGTKPVTLPPRGSSRSPDGAHIAIPTPLGLLVDGTTHEIWQIDGWDFATSSGCVVANGGARAACLRGARAELYLKSDAKRD